MTKLVTKAKIRTDMLKEFLNEYVTIFMTGLNTQAQSAEGDLLDVPMVAEGLLVDYDINYLMISDAGGTIYSLINHDCIGKIDIGEPVMEFDPSMPKKKEMN
jgi:hypothetical protein